MGRLLVCSNYRLHTKIDTYFYSSLKYEKDWQDSPIDEFWFQNRRAFSIFLADNETIFPSRQCYDLYTRYTRLYKPPDLHSNTLVSQFCSVDYRVLNACLKANRELTDPEISVFMKKLSQALGTGAMSDLEDDIWEHLVRELGQMSFCSKRSKHKMQYINDHPSLRSDSRTDWDTLTYSLLNRVSTTDSSHRIRSECVIPMTFLINARLISWIHLDLNASSGYHAT